MITRAQRIAAARRYAPPLIEVRQADRRGARVRQVSKRAVDYANRAGLALEEVYPQVSQALARFGAEPLPIVVPQPLGWKLPALGLVLGALGGPVGAVVGVAIGGVLAAKGA